MKIKNILMSMLAIAALASCNKENGPSAGTGSQVEEGVATVARIALSQSGATRAGQESATPDESAIKTAVIYIFKSDGILEKVVEFSEDDITNGYKVFATSSGLKYIHVLANIPSNKLIGIRENSTSCTAFEEKIMKINDIAEATTPVTTGNGWWMGTLERWNIRLVPSVSESDANAGRNNALSIRIGRITAKVDVTLSPSATVSAGQFELTAYKVANNPKEFYLLPKLVNNNYTSPNHDENLPDPEKYFNHTDFSTTPVYATENTHARPMLGNTSTVVIKGKFTPSILLDKDGEASSLPGSGTFYRIQTDAFTFTGSYYSEAPTQAEIYRKGGAGAVAVEYPGGTCYYRLLIADNSQTTPNKKYAVLRNHLYKISIVNVNGAGSNTEEGIEPGQPGQPDPDQPVEETTNMKVTIEILPWTVIEQDGGI